MTLDLRVIKKSGWQILNYSDKRKVVEAKDGTKSWSNKKDANKAKDILIAAVATKKVILSDRYKFKEEYLKYATNRLESARDKTIRLSPSSIQGYVTNYNLYIDDCFPDIYIDQVNGKVLEEFIKGI